ncbi:MAG: response regulator [Gammaproteobacteria bacterium]
MDGFELTRHMRLGEAARKLPIIMISSRTAEKHRIRAQELGVNVFLGKPFNGEMALPQPFGSAAQPSRRCHF